MYMYSIIKQKQNNVGVIVWNVAMLWDVLFLFVYFVSQCFYPAFPYIS